MSDAPPARITLECIAVRQLWVAWQAEIRPGGKRPTKVPYDPGSNGKARADVPETWGSREAATLRAARLAKPFGAGGVGLELGPLGDGRHLCGLDLDTCRDVNTGAVEDWAQKLIDRLNTYTEVSPSGTGVKLFCLYAEADRPDLRRALGVTGTGNLRHGASWSRRTATDHPPAIELHLSNRYFAVTGETLPGCTAELRQLAPDELLQIILVEGPAFARGGNDTDAAINEKAGAAISAQQCGEARLAKCHPSERDQSRSVQAFKVGAQARRKGANFEGMCEAIRNNTDTTDWYLEKGLADDRRELRRIWDKIDPLVGDLVLYAASPLDSARQFIARQHTRFGLGWPGPLRTLQHQNATYYTWLNSHYVETTPEVIRSTLYGFLDQAQTITDAEKIVPFNPNRNKIANVLEAIASEAQLHNVRPPAWLTGHADVAASELIACRNGLLHLPTRALLPHTPAFFTLNALSFDFDPQAAAPTAWLSFLASVWPNDLDAISTLQELFGLLLTADTSHQKAFLVVGPKRSGKGTIARVLTELLGAANVCSPTLSGISTNFGIAPLIGKSLAIISDARLSGKADQAIIAERLLAITGEDAQTVDRKFRDPWNGKLNTRFLILTNELPRLTDTSGALASRFILLTIQQSFFGNEDRGLLAKITRDLPGILLWAIEGLQRLQHRGHFVPPASSLSAMNDLEDLGSPINAFLRDCCIVGPGLGIWTNDLYSDWCEWCRQHGRDHTGTTQTFSRDLGAALPGLQTVQRRRDGIPTRLYEGVSVSPERVSRSVTRYRTL